MAARAPRSWILKSEPDTFGIDHLIALKDKTTLWDGVRNFTARNNLVAMEIGDRGYFYHSSCAVPAIVGEMKVVAKAVPDESAFDKKSPYFDAKSKRDKPQWFSPKFKFIKKYPVELTREILAAAGLKDSLLFKSFRLSVIPLTEAEVKIIDKLISGGKKS
jgi:predicted RNA-binding protein with PUA-like domain